MKWSLAVVALVPALAGCLAEQSAYSVRRAALVPHAVPSTSTGHPLERATELSFGTLAAPVAPTQGDADAGLHVPSHQLDAGFRIKPAERFDVGLVYRRGFNSGSTSLSADQPDVPRGDAVGYGVSMRYSADTGVDALRLGLRLDLLTYSIPYVEYRTCVSDCTSLDKTRIDEGSAIVPGIAVGITPSYRSGSVTVYGGVTLANHPTVDKAGMETGFDGDSDVETGPLNAVASAGADIAIADNIRASVVVYQPLNRAPVSYGPTFAMGIKIPLGPPATRRD